MKLLLTTPFLLLSLHLFAQDINTQEQEISYQTSIVKSDPINVSDNQQADSFDDFTLVVFYDDKSFKRSLKGKKVRSLSLVKGQKQSKRKNSNK